MLTINTLLKDIKDVPLHRLEELYEFVHSLMPNAKKAENKTEEILSFGGAFKDFTEKEYVDFVKETKNSRAELFNRNIDL